MRGATAISFQIVGRGHTVWRYDYFFIGAPILTSVDHARLGCAFGVSLAIHTRFALSCEVFSGYVSRTSRFLRLEVKRVDTHI